MVHIVLPLRSLRVAAPLRVTPGSPISPQRAEGATGIKLCVVPEPPRS